MIVEWYIPDDKELYHKLLSHKSEIESELNLQLDWRELPTKKASRIVAEHSLDFSIKDQWFGTFDWMMDISIKMKKVFKKYY